jgi:hypothetical protein
MKRRTKEKRIQEKLADAKYGRKVAEVPAWLKERLDEKIGRARKKKVNDE